MHTHSAWHIDAVLPEQEESISSLERAVTALSERAAGARTGEGKWLLEVVNDVNTSTCWTETFDTDKEALDEALRTIEENGIEEFHVSQPWREH
ncbi:MAG: hypothetical protein ACRETY_12295, partial [Steroidobacteraceae bacterium]